MWETAVGSPGGRHETITLQAETRTPRGRTLFASFVRDRTPPSELPPAQRQRKKNEGKGRARAMLRLDSVKHDQYLEAERTRKRVAAQRAAGGEMVDVRAQETPRHAVGGAHAELPSPAWKQQARERVAAEMQAIQQRKDERAARGQKAREQREFAAARGQEAREQRTKEINAYLLRERGLVCATVDDWPRVR